MLDSQEPRAPLRSSSAAALLGALLRRLASSDLGIELRLQRGALVEDLLALTSSTRATSSPSCPATAAPLSHCYCPLVIDQTIRAVEPSVQKPQSPPVSLPIPPSLPQLPPFLPPLPSLPPSPPSKCPGEGLPPCGPQGRTSSSLNSLITLA